jgi:hypothetical protein
MKIQQAEKSLACAVEISDGSVTTCSYESYGKAINKSDLQSKARRDSIYVLLIFFPFYTL